MSTNFRTKTGALKLALRNFSGALDRVLSVHEAHLLEMAEAEIATIDGGLRLVGEMRETYGRIGVLTPRLACALDEAEDDYLRMRGEQMRVRDALRSLTSDLCPLTSEKGGRA